MQLLSIAQRSACSLPPPEPCRGPSGLLPFGSAPWTSPVALLGYQDQDRLTGLTIAFHLHSRAAHSGAVTIEAKRAPAGFFTAEKCEHAWTRSWAPSVLQCCGQSIPAIPSAHPTLASMVCHKQGLVQWLLGVLLFGSSPRAGYGSTC